MSVGWEGKRAEGGTDIRREVLIRCTLLNFSTPRVQTESRYWRLGVRRMSDNIAAENVEVPLQPLVVVKERLERVRLQ